MIASPCINLCKMNPASGLCAGCFRTLEEISAWSAADDTRRRQILIAVAARRRQSAASPGSLPDRAAP
ncbi:MAG: DUF1289 domain-containing protein [Dechloromonas sp.]|nr:MAG: DUF1289 domain-containing protein [Dechloromonas sp.]